MNILFGLTSYSQDIIYTKTQGEIKSKIIEIAANEVKYKNYDNQEGPVVVIRKTDVIKIIYENGKEEVIMPDKNAVKIQLFSLLSGHLALGYERVVKPGFNIETTIGIINVGIINVGMPQFRSDEVLGGFAKISMKFLLGENFVKNGMKISQPLKGAYTSFELAFSHFTEKDVAYGYSYDIRKGEYIWFNTDVRTNAFASNIILGKQWVLGQLFTLDTYIGAGYGIALFNPSSPDVSLKDLWYTPFYYSHYFFEIDFSGIALTGGISIGYIF